MLDDPFLNVGLKFQKSITIDLTKEDNSEQRLRNRRTNRLRSLPQTYSCCVTIDSSDEGDGISEPGSCSDLSRSRCYKCPCDEKASHVIKTKRMVNTRERYKNTIFTENYPNNKFKSSKEKSTNSALNDKRNCRSSIGSCITKHHSVNCEDFRMSKLDEKTARFNPIQNQINAMREIMKRKKNKQSLKKTKIKSTVETKSANHSKKTCLRENRTTVIDLPTKKVFQKDERTIVANTLYFHDSSNALKNDGLNIKEKRWKNTATDKINSGADNIFAVMDDFFNGNT